MLNIKLHTKTSFGNHKVTNEHVKKLVVTFCNQFAIANKID